MSGDLNGDRGRGPRAPPPAATERHPDESPFSEIQHPRKRAFLTAYAHTGNKRLAAKLAGIDRSAIYQPGWRDDRKFEDALARAELMACDILEAEAYRRAVEGVEKPVGWYKGRPGGYVREYSDVLLIFLLKGIRPEKYRDRMELRGAFANLNLDLLPDAAIERLAKGEHPLSVLASWAADGGDPEALRLPPAGRGGRMTTGKGSADG
jgi:hypothetical protein